MQATGWLSSVHGTCTVLDAANGRGVGADLLGIVGQHHLARAVGREIDPLEQLTAYCPPPAGAECGG